MDVGTDNERLRADKVYMGLNQPRLKGDAYVAVRPCKTAHLHYACNCR